jgi:hypothetical protein
MKCPMCDSGIAEIDYKGIKICKDCSKMLNKSIENAPIICNGNVIGVVKSKAGGTIECILWDKFVCTEIDNHGNCSAVVIGDNNEYKI